MTKRKTEYTQRRSRAGEETARGKAIRAAITSATLVAGAQGLTRPQLCRAVGRDDSSVRFHLERMDSVVVAKCSVSQRTKIWHITFAQQAREYGRNGSAEAIARKLYHISQQALDKVLQCARATGKAGTNVKHLTQATGLAANTVGHALQELESRGAIVRHRDPLQSHRAVMRCWATEHAPVQAPALLPFRSNAKALSQAGLEGRAPRKPWMDFGHDRPRQVDTRPVIVPDSVRIVRAPAPVDRRWLPDVRSHEFARLGPGRYLDERQTEG